MSARSEPRVHLQPVNTIKSCSYGLKCIYVLMTTSFVSQEHNKIDKPFRNLLYQAVCILGYHFVTHAET